MITEKLFLERPPLADQLRKRCTTQIRPFAISLTMLHRDILVARIIQLGSPLSF